MDEWHSSIRVFIANAISNSSGYRLRQPSEAIAPLGVKPEDVSDIFLSHMHWDHAGGIELFPSARIWLQKAEYHYYTGDAWQARNTHGGIDQDDVLEIVRRNMLGKVTFLTGDDDTSISGITFGIGGKHTQSRSSSPPRAAREKSCSLPTTCISTKTSTCTSQSRRRSMQHQICARRIACVCWRRRHGCSFQGMMWRSSVDFQRSGRGSCGSIDAVNA